MLFDKIYDPNKAEELYNELPRLPRAVELIVKGNNFCVNDCWFCMMASDEEADRNGNAILKQVKPFIEDMNSNGSLVYSFFLSGGMPLLNDDTIPLLKHLKKNCEKIFLNKKHKVSIVTSGIDPRSKYVDQFNKAFRELVSNKYVSELSLSYSAGKYPKERIKSLDSILRETKAFDRLNVELRFVGMDEEVLSFLPNADENYDEVNKLEVFNSGRGSGELKPEAGNCIFTKYVSVLRGNKEFYKIKKSNNDEITKKPLYFSLTIDEKGNFQPCCATEAWITKIPPYANIFRHDYKEVIKRMLYYHEVFKKFFWEKMPCRVNCNNCCVKGERFKDYVKRLKKPIKLLQW